MTVSFNLTLAQANALEYISRSIVLSHHMGWRADGWTIRDSTARALVAAGLVTVSTDLGLARLAATEDGLSVVRAMGGKRKFRLSGVIEGAGS